jgi:hypothetical protein
MFFRNVSELIQSCEGQKRYLLCGIHGKRGQFFFTLSFRSSFSVLCFILFSCLKIRIGFSQRVTGCISSVSRDQ